MEEERNFILFIVLSFAIIFSWALFMGPKPKKNDMPSKEQVETKSKGAQQEPERVAVGIYPEKLEPVKEVSEQAEEPERTIRIETKVLELEFSTKGALPVHWKLKNYKDRIYYPYEISISWPPFRRVEKFEPQPIDLVNKELKADKMPVRSRIQIDNIVIGESASWRLKNLDSEVKVEKEPYNLEFELALPNGILRKIYTFYPDDYTVEMKLVGEGVVSQANKASVELFLNFIFEPKTSFSSVNFQGPLFHNGKSLTRIKLKELDKKGAVDAGLAQWAGYTDSYFLTAVIAESGPKMQTNVSYSGSREVLKEKKANKEYQIGLAIGSEPSQILKGELAKVKIFAGPKDKKILMQSYNTLQYSIDYGSLSFIVIPLLAGLHFIYLGVKNYGLAIIIFTIALRMAMFPLTRKSQRSMKELAKLKPEIDKIHKKYPNDRLKQQEELASLYRKYKINPMSGCIPIIIQIPIFFAFYKALLISIELRHAPFFLWIQDLSSRDPLLILPVLMGATQVIMQVLTPTTSADPVQAKMMMIMPIVFTFLLLYFPSGLLLYWTVSNIVGIGQQLYVNYKSD